MSNEEIVKNNFPPETIYEEIETENGTKYSISYVDSGTKQTSMGEVPVCSCGNSGMDFQRVLEGFTQNMADNGWDVNNKIWQ